MEVGAGAPNEEGREGRGCTLFADEGLNAIGFSMDIILGVLEEGRD